MTVRKRGSVWYYDFQIRGTRYREALPEARTKDEAREAETKAKREVFDGLWQSKRLTAPTLRKYVDDVFLPWSKANKTGRGDNNRCAALCAAMGNLPLDQISVIQIEGFKQQQQKLEKNPITINHYLATLGQILRQAINQGLIKENPCAKVRPLRQEPHRTRYLTQVEEERLFEAIDVELEREDLTREARRNLESLRAAITIALATGMRQGEIYGLTWDRVDFSRNTITLARTKTNKTRVIPIGARLRELLLSLFESRGDSQKALPGRYHGAYWGPVRKAAGIEDFRFHDLRHTAATRLAEMGTDPFTISAILGHTNVQMTARYAHATSDGTRRAIEGLSDYGRERLKIVSIEERRKQG
jgi:integrase